MRWIKCITWSSWKEKKITDIDRKQNLLFIKLISWQANFILVLNKWRSSISSSRSSCLRTIDYSIIMQYCDDTLDIKNQPKLASFAPIFNTAFPSSEEVDIASTKWVGSGILENKCMLVVLSFGAVDVMNYIISNDKFYICSNITIALLSGLYPFFRTLWRVFFAQK